MFSKYYVFAGRIAMRREMGKQVGRWAVWSWPFILYLIGLSHTTLSVGQNVYEIDMRSHLGKLVMFELSSSNGMV